MQFKDRLRMLRKEKKMTQMRLGNLLNYGYTAIANYESGRNNPCIEDLKKLAAIFNVSMDYLLCVNDIRHPYIKDDTSNEFNEVRRFYAKLSPKKIDELLMFMEWLVARPEEEENIEKGKKSKTSKIENTESISKVPEISTSAYEQPSPRPILQAAEDIVTYQLEDEKE
ncbi:helix-turn-helix transcriptional regulator [Clostridium sp. MD294]|uniref:helix-turn-helix domain-containing protein n=1 Tax=Clostridium sp. MD294 TaxID=97138 RepID=UPI0002C94998|nr:helix-turn-helix transcriptional regulator [Clostridium sp. MD294]NDO46101.1 helix-turn-helix transcriptional regulator [Clostridium sp. MD294]USF30233.1 hypothetical protein C820_001674 [Clostridium sp. MD294]